MGVPKPGGTTTRRGELIRTRAVQQCLNALMPSEPSFHGEARDWSRQAGVFLETGTTLFVDSYWREEVGGKPHQVRRRVIVDFDVVEEVLDMLE